MAALSPHGAVVHTKNAVVSAKFVTAAPVIAKTMLLVDSAGDPYQYEPAVETLVNPERGVARPLPEVASRAVKP